MTTWQLWLLQILSTHREFVSRCWKRCEKQFQEANSILSTAFQFIEVVPSLRFSQVLDEFSKQVDSIDWPSGKPETITYKGLDIHLAAYQVSWEALCGCRNTLTHLLSSSIATNESRILLCFLTCLATHSFESLLRMCDKKSLAFQLLIASYCKVDFDWDYSLVTGSCSVHQTEPIYYLNSEGTIKLEFD